MAACFRCYNPGNFPIKTLTFLPSFPRSYMVVRRRSVGRRLHHQVAFSLMFSEQNGQRLKGLFKAENDAHAGHHVAARVEAVLQAARSHLPSQPPLQPVHERVEEGKYQRAHRRPLDGAVQPSLKQIVLLF